MRSLRILLILACGLAIPVGYWAGWKRGQAQVLAKVVAAREVSSAESKFEASTTQPQATAHSLLKRTMNEALSGNDDELWIITLRKLAGIDPAAAWQALTRREDLETEVFENLISGILAAWAARDMDRAFDAWLTLPDGQRQLSVNALTCLGDNTRARTRLLSRIGMLPDEDAIRAKAYDRALRNWAFDVSIEEAGQWLDSRSAFSPEQRANLERAMAFSSVFRDPDTVTNWLLNRSTPERRSADLEALVSGWAGTEPNACGKWLGSLTLDSDTDDAVGAFAERIVRDDPESAVAWAKHITKPERRIHALIQIMSDWKRSEPTAAQAFYGSSGLNDEERSKLKRFMR